MKKGELSRNNDDLNGVHGICFFCPPKKWISRKNATTRDFNGIKGVLVVSTGI
jgi:hypothetical protein